VTAIRLKASVPENRQITLTLPSSVPVGEAELEIVIREAVSIPEIALSVTIDRPKAYPPRPTNPILAPEYDAFEGMLPDLLKEHTGKYVAIRDAKVVATGDTEIDVLTAAHQQLPGRPVYVRLVTDQPQPLSRIGSPRMISRIE
jgi:hypothetical protein